MNIAILGTRGIPNRYGGFEYFAENLSRQLVKRGHRVTVYSPHNHPHKENDFCDVLIKKKWFPDKLFGPFANLLYDYLCLADAKKSHFDILFEMGYTFTPLLKFIKLNKLPPVIVHMDGIEWKRKRWGFIPRLFIRYCEKEAMKKLSRHIVDHPIIKDYFNKKYNTETTCIPYGVEHLKTSKKIIDNKNLKPNQYDLLIARLVPENHITTIIEGKPSDDPVPLIITGNYKNGYGKKIYKKYHKRNNIQFTGGIYDKEVLDSLRLYARYYFHGHSVGGTNPSLLEAMAAGCLIVAHENRYSQYILEDSAFYFKCVDDIKSILNSPELLDDIENQMRTNVKKKAERNYNWEIITAQYEKYLISSY